MVKIDLSSKKWRMNNLYHIIDKDGNSIIFKMNPVQQHLFENIHSRNLILKARQLGMSTFAVLYLLDETLFCKNLSCGIVSYSLEHAQHIFKRIIGHALDHFSESLKPYLGIINRSAREITFNNGSFLRVDTSLRGGSYQMVLVSEFGKTCSRSPQKAEEVITGTLQTVPINGTIIIESTGEGNDGFYADMINQAHQRGNDNLTALDYKLFFYPWFTDSSYCVEDMVSKTFTPEQNDYFAKVQKDCSVTLTHGQKCWYSLQERILGDKVKQEFPSTVSESFLSSNDAYYFALAINKAYQEGRCLSISPYDALMPIYIAMDIGVNDLTVIIFFQIGHGEVRVIDYYEDKDKDVDFYAKFLLQDKKYLYHTIFLPHDAVKRSIHDVSNTYERDFKRLFTGTSTRFHVLKRMDKQLSISHARNMINRTVFNINRVKPLVEAMSKYRKQWHEGTGRYLEDPLHNQVSNASDCWQYVSQAVTHLETVCGREGAFESHKKVVENRYKRVI